MYCVRSCPPQPLAVFTDNHVRWLAMRIAQRVPPCGNVSARRFADDSEWLREGSEAIGSYWETHSPYGRRTLHDES